MYLYDTLERVNLEKRAASTDDNRAVAGVHSEQHHQALTERIKVFEKLAAEEALPGYTQDTSERIEL